MEKFCPTCSRVFSNDATVCEDDGEPLVLIENEQSLIGHVLDGKYTLLSKLGEGGMGSVYLATQSGIDREVAIKVLRTEFSRTPLAIKRFLREARVVSRLTHPNTITVYDFGRSNDGLLYLAMERLMGRSLADVMDSEAPLLPERAAHIFGQICDSLQEAHAQGITHRDLKPENIFIEQKIGNDDFVKVLDFGIAKTQEEEPTGQATATGMICGTPSYMSPEQAMGRDLDGRSDIYALGVLLFEMLTMRKPYEGDAPMEVMLKHINEPVPNILKATGVDVPVGIQRAIEALLAKRVEDRPLNCQEAKRLVSEGLHTPFMSAMAAIPEAPPKVLGEGLSEALTSFDLSQAKEPQSSSKGMTWVMVLMGLLALLGVLWALWPRETELVASNQAEKNLLAEAETRVAQLLAEAETTKAEAEATKAKAEAEAKAAAESARLALEAATKAEEEAKARAQAAEEARLAAVSQQAARQGGAGSGAVVEALDEEQWVSLTIESDPPRAEIYDGEQLLGAAPLVLQRPKNSTSVSLSLRARGYRTQSIELETDSDKTMTVELKKMPRRLDAGTDGFGTF